MIWLQTWEGRHAPSAVKLLQINKLSPAPTCGGLGLPENAPCSAQAQAGPWVGMGANGACGWLPPFCKTWSLRFGLGRPQAPHEKEGSVPLPMVGEIHDVVTQSVCGACSTLGLAPRQAGPGDTGKYARGFHLSQDIIILLID